MLNLLCAALSTTIAVVFYDINLWFCAANAFIAVLNFGCSVRVIVEDAAKVKS